MRKQSTVVVFCRVRDFEPKILIKCVHLTHFEEKNPVR